jgi:hypothetical protein
MRLQLARARWGGSANPSGNRDDCIGTEDKNPSAIATTLAVRSSKTEIPVLSSQVGSHLVHGLESNISAVFEAR